MTKTTNVFATAKLWLGKSMNGWGVLVAFLWSASVTVAVVDSAETATWALFVFWAAWLLLLSLIDLVSLRVHAETPLKWITAQEVEDEYERLTAALQFGAVEATEGLEEWQRRVGAIYMRLPSRYARGLGEAAFQGLSKKAIQDIRKLVEDPDQKGWDA